MIIKNGIIFIWSGTNALIPSGWSRVTSMDDTYPKGTADATNPNTTGGATTHTHTSTAHSHATAQAHTHTITIPNGSGGLGTSTGSNTDANTHNHSTVTSGAVGSFSTSSVAATYAAFSNDPPFYKVIYITPTAQTNAIPSGVIGLADAAAPTGFSICDGTASTPNLVDTYLKGASTGANAGTTGGTTTNTHGLTHTHTTSHVHAAVTSPNSPGSGVGSQASGANIVNTGAHNHSVSLLAATPSTTDNVTLAASAETVEPAYTKLLAIQATSIIQVPLNIIAMWTGTLANIPTGWILCDGTGGTIDMRSRHLKITGTVGAVGNTGGSNTHTHASQNHSHTVAHTHTQSLGHSNVRGSGGSGATAASSATTHSVTTDSVNLVIDNAATTANSSNNEPAYRTVAFIKLNERRFTSAPVLAFITNL